MRDLSKSDAAALPCVKVSTRGGHTLAVHTSRGWLPIPWTNTTSRRSSRPNRSSSSAGYADDPAGQTAQARALQPGAARAALQRHACSSWTSTTRGTLADLAQTRADLAIIALPPQDVAAALEIAGRITCRSALVISSGIDADQAAELQKIARREGVHLLGPNCLGLQRPQLQLNASAAGPLAARRARWRWCRSRAR